MPAILTADFRLKPSTIYYTLGWSVFFFFHFFQNHSGHSYRHSVEKLLIS